MTTIDMFNEVASSAVLSPCGKYRYRLDRTWGDGPVLCWVMCNPSTADASADDPTIRRLLGYSRRWGFGALVVVNLWAWRATDPASLPFGGMTDVVGPDANAHIKSALEVASGVVCAWGSSVRERHRDDRASEVVAMMFAARHRPKALKVNADGTPAHPLYQRNDATLVDWPAA